MADAMLTEASGLGTGNAERLGGAVGREHPRLNCNAEGVWQLQRRGGMRVWQLTAKREPLAGSAGERTAGRERGRAGGPLVG